MATNTPNFNLKKPATTDNALIGDINGNMDKVDVSLNGLADAIAIVANGNTHAAITSGQYVYVHGHGTLAEGLYKANSNIAANATLTSSNLTADGSGGLNALNADKVSKSGGDIIDGTLAVTELTAGGNTLRPAVKCALGRDAYGNLITKAELFADGEGGNLNLYSPNGIEFQIDHRNDDDCRGYTFDGNGNLKTIFDVNISTGDAYIGEYNVKTINSSLKVKPQSINANSVTETSIIRTTSGSTNLPSITNVEGILVSYISYTDGAYVGVQYFTEYATNKDYTRLLWYGTWRPWQELALNSKSAKKLSMSLPSTANVFNVALNRETDFVIGIHVKNANGDWLDNNYTTVSDGKPIVSVLHSGYMRLNFADYASKDIEILYIQI